MSRIREGDRAPDFIAKSHEGENVALADFHGKKTVVLYFYPKDETPGCTKEACGFRDAYEDFARAGAVVIGVSGDSEGSHRSFASRHRLPFLLVSDEDGALRRAFGVPRTLGLLPGRVTYVIDPQGVVRHVFDSQLFVGRHVSDALEIVERVAETRGEGGAPSAR